MHLHHPQVIKDFIVLTSHPQLEGCFERTDHSLAKYVVSPPISLRRIDRYDGQRVTYHYRSHKSERVEWERVDVYTFIGRMVQHTFPKGFQRVRYYGVLRTGPGGDAKSIMNQSYTSWALWPVLPWGLPARHGRVQATKTFAKIKVLIQTALAKVRGVVKGASQIIATKTYRQRYEQSSGRDPLTCPHCRSAMDVWRIWHPISGIIHDELKAIARGKYESQTTRAGPA